MRGSTPAIGRSLTHGEILARTRAEFAGTAPAAGLSFHSIRTDHRASDGDLFVAIRGTSFDSHTLIPELPRYGLRGVIAESAPPIQYPLPYYRVANSRAALAELEQAFHGDPGRSLRVFGITGTNGKSTSVRLLSAVLESAGGNVGWMSTVTQRLGEEETPQKLTTPTPHDIARGMASLIERGGSDIVLEVSSHALVQERVAGLTFAGAIFTNLTRDHLDFHGTFAAYLAAKMRLFELCAPGAPAVFAKHGAVDAKAPQLRALRALTFSADAKPAFGAGSKADARPDAHPVRVRLDEHGTRGTLRVLAENLEFESPLVGRHNLENILGVALLARASGISPSAIAAGLAAAPPVRGRLEAVAAERGRIFVDYAHTPDALSSVLGAAREFTRGQLVVLFGCGGDRDRGKRPQMGEIAERLADRVIVTSDNPRSEEPARIVEDILGGMSRGKSITIEVDRRAALARALNELGDQDVLIVAGKGHEREQLIGQHTFPFDDREVIQELLREGVMR